MARRSALRPALLVALLAAIGACAPSWKAVPHDQPFQIAAEPRLHPLPQTSTHSDWWDKVLHSTVRPLGRLVSPARYLDWMRGGRPALDLNAFGQVANSPWFHNRIGLGNMTPEQVGAGPGGTGPPHGTLTVISGKLEGATPGVVVRDASGVIWFIKFDPPGFPELSTGAEVVASRILHAAGYWVPETYAVDLSIGRLAIAPDAKHRDRYNRNVAMSERDLRRLLFNLNPDPAGKLPALMSRAVPGKPVGPFEYRGVRIDDPNDRIPHERRRSLRGLWLLSAWINNTDPRSQNTLDTFVPMTADRKRGYVRHYLIDFGDSLGAAGERAKYPGEGYEGQLDWREIGKRWLSFGALYPYWLGVTGGGAPALGLFEAEVFDPERWSPNFPNPAFEAATARDSFWAAAIAARFTRAHIDAAIAAAGYSSREVAHRIGDILVARREKILRHVFASMLPIDAPAIADGTRLEMTDLAELAELRKRPARYAWSARWNRTRGRDVQLAKGEGERPVAELAGAIERAGRRAGFADDPFITVTFRGKRHPAAVEVHLRVVDGKLMPVALHRDVY